ncbi:MAG: LEA type 2 family protein [Candidatus Margulisbacteria bacterium]|nr:LEA type 2 family protein [Candidatus Margulisiibacteriota bacterium]
MKRRIVALFFLLSLALVLTSCVQPSPPEVKYLNYTLGRLMADGLEVNFNFEVFNPNPIPLNVTNYSYKIYINEKELASASREGFSLAASAKSRVTILAFVRYDQLFGSVVSLLDRLSKGINTFDYRIEGEVNAGLLGLTVSTPIRAAGTIPIPKDVKITL